MLPKKWFVRRNPDNYLILNAWTNEKFRTDAFRSDEGCIYSDKSYSCSLDDPKNEYTEIFFEDFQRYVLNKIPIYELY